MIKNGFDVSNSAIPAHRIKKGGPPRDGIPSIDRPQFIAAHEADYLQDEDRVMGVYRNGISKAYPIRILEWHEVVNDRLGNEAVVITYCPLCGTGMVFSVEGVAAKPEFGVSGLLYNSDVLLYDRATQSLWSQILGQAISGPLKGVTLDLLPSSHTTWREWRGRYPQTWVLSQDTGYRRNYDASPYLDYARTGRLMFPVENTNRAYSNKEMVLGVAIDGRHKAYPFKELEINGEERFSDAVAGVPITIEWLASDRSARVYDARGVELPSVLAYWFAWYAFHPDTGVFKAGADQH